MFYEKTNKKRIYFATSVGPRAFRKKELLFLQKLPLGPEAICPKQIGFLEKA